MKTRLHRTRKESATAMHNCITEIWTDVHERRRDLYRMSTGEYTRRYRVSTIPKSLIIGIMLAETPPTLDNAIDLRKSIRDDSRPRQHRVHIPVNEQTMMNLSLFGTEYDPKDVAFPPRIDNVQRFRDITEQMASTYERKNADYGNSFGESVDEFGAVAGVVRIGDKFNRLKNLIKNPGTQRVNDESIADTLLDMANYCIMLKIEIDNQQIIH
jgi:hypothetical protein